MCSITLVEVEAYKVLARQIIIKADNIQILKRDNGLNTVGIYNTVIDKSKPV